MSAEDAMKRISIILDWGLPDATTVTRIMETVLQYEEEAEKPSDPLYERYQDNPEEI